jgi:hypothetical protein
MLESGCVSLKNEVNIMMKNVVDIVLGGLTYWIFGFGFSFGLYEPNNPLIGIGGLLLDPSIDDEYMGSICAAFLFQLSFATTSTTIVSGAMAERYLSGEYKNENDLCAIHFVFLDVISKHIASFPFLTRSCIACQLVGYGAIMGF